VGFWLASNGEAVAEVHKNSIIVTIYEENLITGEYTYLKLKGGKYQLTDSGTPQQESLRVFLDGDRLTLSGSFSQFEPIDFRQAPKLSKDDYTGIWYSHSVEQYLEDSIIVIQREHSYDFDAIYIDHALKTYEKTLNLNIKMSFENGFIFTDELPNNDNFVYFVESFNENTLNYIDTEGFRWSQTRMQEPEHIKIPNGYSEEE
jgi:hypothetical protein